jgi:predicted Ser/Thr protein kinase
VSERIGDYVVVKEIAQGAMGVVLLARDPKGRDVAIKRLHARRSRLEDSEVVRFQREGDVAGALRHPGIVRLIHAGHDERGPYHVLEYVPGRSLKQVLSDEGPLPWRRAVEVTVDLAEALTYAHGEGVLHRDVKPANVLVEPSGRVRLTDFGLAKVSEEHGLTTTGEILGTPLYMSPEQARADEVGPHTDVYGLGATFYACLTGRPPVEAHSIADAIQRILHDPPLPPRSLAPDLPPRVEAVCLKALGKGVDERYATPAQLVEALGDLRHHVSRQPMTSASRGVSWAVGGVVVAALGLAALIVGVALREDASPGVSPAAGAGGAASPQPTEDAVAEEARSALEQARQARRHERSHERTFEAWEAVGRALELDPGLGEAYTLRAELALEQQDLARAVSDLSRARELGVDADAVLARRFADKYRRRLVWVVYDEGEGSLEEAALLVSRLTLRPTLHVAGVLERLDRVADTLRPKLEGTQGVERLERLVTLVHSEVVSGDLPGYYDLSNYCLDQVLDDGEGNHLSNGIILIALGDRLELPLSALCLPEGFQVLHAGPPARLVDAHMGRLGGLVEAATPASRLLVILRLTVSMTFNLQQKGRTEEAEQTQPRHPTQVTGLSGSPGVRALEVSVSGARRSAGDAARPRPRRTTRS